MESKYYIHIPTGSKFKLIDKDKSYYYLKPKGQTIKTIVPIDTFNEYYKSITEKEFWGTVLTENKPETDNKFYDICRGLVELHDRKNHDYGDTFSILFKKIGMNYAFGHLAEKLARIETLKDNPAKVKGESMIDSLRDLASYSIMTIIALQNGSN